MIKFSGTQSGGTSQGSGGMKSLLKTAALLIVGYILVQFIMAQIIGYYFPHILYYIRYVPI